MKKKIMKTVALLLAAMMTLSACGKETAKEESKAPVTSESKVTTSESTTPAASESEEPQKYYNEEGFPIVNEEITLKLLTINNVSGTTVSSTKDAPFWDWISEKTGIKFEIESYDKAELATKLPLILADPDSMPDIIWGTDMNESIIADSIDKGIFLQMDDYIEALAPNIQAAFASNPIFRPLTTSVDGHIYSLPSYNVARTAWTYQINDVWMKNCGIEEYPTTMEELKEVLITFRDMDANGNGDPNDEIPLRASISGMYETLAHAVGAQLDKPREGAVWSSRANSTETFPMWASEEGRYVIEFIASLYKEGLVESDMYTINSDEIRERREADRYGVFARQEFAAGGDYTPDDYTSIPIITSALNDTQTYFLQPLSQTGAAIISATTEYPEACIRFFDYMMSAEGTALTAAVNPADCDMAAAGVSQEVIDIITKQYEGKTSTDREEVMANWIGMYGCRWMAQLEEHQYPGTYANNIARTNIENVQAKQTVENSVTSYTSVLKFTAEENEVISQYKADIDLFIKDQMAKWISNKEELNDTTWQAYLDQLDKMHIGDLQDVHQTAVNRFYGVE